MWSKPDEWTIAAIKGRALKYQDSTGYFRFAASELRKRIADYESRRAALGSSQSDRQMSAKLSAMIQRERDVLRAVEREL